MSDKTQSDSASARVSSSSMRGEIQLRWDKFSAEEISALQEKDGLVAQVQAKYAVDKDQAPRDVYAFAKGRQIVANQAARYQSWRRG
jgi:hypothetical protein